MVSPRKIHGLQLRFVQLKNEFRTAVIYTA